MKFISLQTIWPGTVVLGLGLIAYGWAAQRGWTSEPTDAHSSRQAQTVITSQMLHDNGLAPITPFNGLGPPWNVPMEFPTYQMAVAGVAHLTGGNVVTAGRWVGVGGTLALLPALWLLLGHTRLGLNERLITLGLMLVVPLWMHFSRSVLIESWATAFSFWWLAALTESLLRDDPHRRWWYAAIGLSVVAALTKVTTFAVLLPVSLAITAHAWRRNGHVSIAKAAAASLPAIGVALWWTHRGDALKHAHPYADFLTSKNLSSWNWGTLEQRFDPAWWQQIGTHFTLMFPPWILVPIVAGMIWSSPQQRRILLLAGVAALTGPVAFANLYFVHSYYLMAVAPAVVLGLGIATGTLFQRFATSQMRQVIFTCLVVGFGWFQINTYRQGLGYGQVRNQPLPPLGLLLQDLTSPDDHIAIFGREWDPLLTYTIDRPLAFIRENYETDEDAWQLSRRGLAPDDYTVLVASEAVAGDLAFVQHRVEELGLGPLPVASTPDSDIYVAAAEWDRVKTQLVPWLESGLVLPHRPPRMGPGESRREFIATRWRPLDFDSARSHFTVCQPHPTALFSRYEPALLAAFGEQVLHLHPPAGLRFNALSRARTVTMAYGLRPEVWQNPHDSDGVRFRFLTRGPDGRQRLVWSEFVQPLSRPEHQKLLHAEVPLPAQHELELWIDAGPDHNPGYDWSIIANLRIE